MTVQEMLDGLHAGTLTLDEVAADFAARDWPTTPRPTMAQLYGVHDDEHPDDNSWRAVSTDPFLSDSQYRTLYEAVHGAQGAQR